MSYYRVDIIVFSVIILIFLHISVRQHSLASDKSAKLFIGILWTLIISLIAEAISYEMNGLGFNGARIANYFSTSVILAITPLPIIAWISYFDYRVFDDYRGLQHRTFYYLIPFYLSFGMVLVNPWTDFLFYITNDNRYHRGPGVFINFGVIVLWIILAFTYIYFKGNIHNHEMLIKILRVMFIPFAATVIQLAMPQFSVMWVGFTLATFMSYEFIIKDSMFKDPLTKASTRGQFELSMHKSIERNESCSIIMIDLDKFKAINDTYGHSQGDIALKEMAKILQESVSYSDLVARYGGDEFMILVRSDRQSVSDEIVERIKKRIDKLNLSNSNPFSIEFSYGSIHIAMENELSAIEVLEKVDQMMYFNKHSKY